MSTENLDEIIGLFNVLRRAANRDLIPIENDEYSHPFPFPSQTAEPQHDEHVKDHDWWRMFGFEDCPPPPKAMRITLTGVKWPRGSNVAVDRKAVKPVEPWQPASVADLKTRTDLTVNDWARLKGLNLTISQATKLGLRAAQLHEKKLGAKAPQVPSRRLPLPSSFRTGPQDRPVYGDLPQHLLNHVGEYPKAILEKAWKDIERDQLLLGKARKTSKE